MVKIFQILLILNILLLLPALALAQVETELEDPFYGQKGTDAIIEAYSSAPFLDVLETVDPFFLVSKG